MAYKHVIRATTKNLFNKNNATIINGYIYSGQLIITESPVDKTIVFSCKPNTTYTFSKMYTNRLFMAETSEETPAVGTTCTNPIESLGEPPSQNYCTLTTTATAKNLIITVCALYNTETYTLQEILDSVQIEEGSTPTPYMPYNYLSSNKRMIKVSDVCQLLDKSIYPVTTTNKGITITNNGDGSVTLNGTATSDGEFYSLQYINLINGHKYFICDNQGGSFANVVFTLDALGSAGNREGNIYTCNITSGPLRRNAYFYVVTGTVISNKVYKPQIFDLTEMFGAGHEPTTVAEFRQRFPNELYPYSPQCWLTSYKSAVVCKTKNLFDVNNAVPYDFSTDDYDSNLVWLKDGIYTTRMNNYNLGSGLRIKNGLSLPAGKYILSVRLVDFYNADRFVLGMRCKNTEGKWVDWSWGFTASEHKSGDILSFANTLPENTDLRLYLSYQNDNGQYLTGYVSYKDIQLEQGPTATSYVPYQHL